MYRFTVDSSACRRALDDLVAGIRNNAVQAVGAAVDAGTAAAKGTTLFKDRSGDLRSKITGTKDAFKGRIKTNSKYAAFVENGTRAHEIVARRATVLAFMQNGAMRFARRVWHPGTSPRPFMREAKGVAELTLNWMMQNSMDRAIRVFNSRGR